MDQLDKCACGGEIEYFTRADKSRVLRCDICAQPPGFKPTPLHKSFVAAMQFSLIKNVGKRISWLSKQDGIS